MRGSDASCASSPTTKAARAVRAAKGPMGRTVMCARCWTRPSRRAPRAARCCVARLALWGYTPTRRAHALPNDAAHTHALEAAAPHEQAATLCASGCNPVRLRLQPCAPQATELIVDAALKYGRPFAVVPCCVFPRLFPHRPQVRTTADFCDYLLRKGTGLEVGFLPVMGRNKVIFRRAAAPPQPERALAIAADNYTPQSVDHGRLAGRGTLVEAQPQAASQVEVEF
jgi:hypothetical protein